MAERLKSILRQTRWSLLIKAVIFAGAWLVLPFWLFLLVALYAYFVPVPQSRVVAGPFLVLLLLIALEPKSLVFAAIFGAIFFYMLLIKEFVLIDRKSAHEVIVLVLSFFLIRDFYIRQGGAMTGWSFFYSFCVALILGLMISNYIRFGGTSEPNTGVKRMAVWLSTLLIWQLIIVGLFLPVDFIYQSVIVFLGVIPLIDLVPQYLFGDATRQKSLIAASVIFVLFVLVLGSARWGL
ncbi:MAG TPA: hypothetical protein VMU07_01405 [Candidatus Paceibacterota bacterium]|nr:hypothetical protein [Candidatus Paceibacterota bacterium]